MTSDNPASPQTSAGAITLAAVLASDERHFIEAAYRAILNREPDADGQDFYLGRLLAGERKLQILQELYTSEEALTKKAQLAGIQSVLRRHRLSNLPLLGPLLGRIMRTEGNSAAEKRLRAAEQKLALAQTLYLSQRQEVRAQEIHEPAALLAAITEASRRQHEFETRQLPTLLESIANLNSRQIAMDNEKDNLVKSVPVALRKLTRDVMELRASAKSPQATFVAAIADEVKSLARRVDEHRDAASTTAVRLEAKITGQAEEISRISARVSEEMRSVEHRGHATFDHIERVARAADQRITLLRDQLEGRLAAAHTEIDRLTDSLKANGRLDGALEDIRYLIGRVEFVRREVMFEMRHGAHTTSGSAEQLRAQTSIVSPKRLLAARQRGIRLNLGCGHISLPDYLNVDRRALLGVDIVAEVDDLPFEPGEVEEIYSSHLIEHFTQEHLRRELLPYWLGLLKAGGHFRAVVPDAQAMTKAFLNGECRFEQYRQVTFGGQDYDGDFHYNMFNTDSFTKLLGEAGYVDIRVVAENRPNGDCREFEIAARCPEKVRERSTAASSR
jgi:predicted SAM-dependent methyltransferase